jgi:hypothetical protein
MGISRKTERFPLSGNALWRDTSAGIFLGGDVEPFYWKASYTNGYDVATRRPTEDNSNTMLHDTNGGATGSDADFTAPGEAGFGLGIKKSSDSLGSLDILSFLYLSKLSATDQAALATNLTGYSSSKRDQYRYGGNLNYKIGSATLTGQLVQAVDGDLSRFFWLIQPAYKFKLADRKYFSATEAVFRYGSLVQNITSNLASASTWDREEFTLGLITDVYKNTKLYTEYTIDRIDKGIDTKSYGEFIAQLEMKF